MEYERQRLDMLRTLLQRLASLDYDIPLNYCIVLVEIMDGELRGNEVIQRDIERSTGLTQPSVSRAVQAITDQRKTKKAVSYNLAKTYPHPLDARLRLIKLTPAGRKLFEDFLFSMKRVDEDEGKELDGKRVSKA